MFQLNVVKIEFNKISLNTEANIRLGVVCPLPWGPRGLAVRRLPRVQEVVGSNPTEGKIYSFTIYYN